MKIRLLSVAVLIAGSFSALAAPLPRPQVVVSCRHNGQGTQLQLDGVFFELPSQGYMARVDGLEVSLERQSNGARVLVGTFEYSDDATACSQSAGLVEAYAPIKLSSSLSVKKDLKAGICTPYPWGGFPWGFGVDWKREVSARYEFSAGEERFALKAKGEFHYRSLDECQNDPRI